MFFPSRPPRGALMRRHDGGTGRGTRGGGRHIHVPGRPPEQTSKRATTGPRRPAPVQGKRRSIPHGAPGGRDASADASARTHSGSPERTREDLSEISGHAPSRRAIPLISGEGKEERLRANPRAQQRTEAAMLCALSATRMNRLERRQCRNSPSPGGGGSRAQRAGWGEREASLISAHPDRLRFAAAVDPPPPGEVGTERVAICF